MTVGECKTSISDLAGEAGVFHIVETEMASMTGKMMEEQYDGAKYQGKVFHPANNVYFFSCFKYDVF